MGTLWHHQHVIKLSLWGMYRKWRGKDFMGSCDDIIDDVILGQIKFSRGSLQEKPRFQSWGGWAVAHNMHSLFELKETCCAWIFSTSVNSNWRHPSLARDTSWQSCTRTACTRIACTRGSGLWQGITYVTLSTSISLFIWSQNFQVLPVENDFATWKLYIFPAFSETVLLQ